MVTQEQELGATGRCQGIASKGLHIELQTGQGCHCHGKVREFFKCQGKSLILRPISLTPILSKVGEEFVVDSYIKPAVLAKIDQNQYGTVLNSSTVHALISMLHNWYKNTDGNGSTVRVVLFDFRNCLLYTSDAADE